MNALLPRARAFVDEGVQSVALSQKQRAQIWTQLQQRIANESPNGQPIQPARSRAVRLTLWQCFAWLGTVATLAAATAVVLVTTPRNGSATLGILFESSPRSDSAACDAKRIATLQLAGSPKLGQQSTSQLPMRRPATAKVSDAQRLAALRVHDGLGEHQVLPQSQLALGRLPALPPKHEKSSAPLVLDQGREIQLSAAQTTQSTVAFRRNGAPTSPAPGQLEFALSPLDDGWHGVPMPFKLTEPQLQLTSYE